MVVLAAVTAWRSGPLGRSAQTTLPTFDKYVPLPLTFNGRVDGGDGLGRSTVGVNGYSNHHHATRDNTGGESPFYSLNLGFYTFHANIPPWQDAEAADILTSWR